MIFLKLRFLCNKAKKRDMLKKLLYLWKNADPGIAEAEDRQLNDLRTFFSHISFSQLIQQLSQLAV